MPLGGNTHTWSTTQYVATAMKAGGSWKASAWLIKSSMSALASTPRITGVGGMPNDGVQLEKKSSGVDGWTAAEALSEDRRANDRYETF